MNSITNTFDTITRSICASDLRVYGQKGAGFYRLFFRIDISAILSDLPPGTWLQSLVTQASLQLPNRGTILLGEFRAPSSIEVESGCGNVVVYADLANTRIHAIEELRRFRQVLPLAFSVTALVGYDTQWNSRVLNCFIKMEVSKAEWIRALSSMNYIPPRDIVSLIGA